MSDEHATHPPTTRASREDNLAQPADAEDVAAEFDRVTAEGGRTMAALAIRKAAPPAGVLAVRAGAGLPTHALAPYLVPQRPGDPLGLGIGPGERPPAPADPDPYDRAREDAEYARSLLEEEERSKLDAEIEKDGYMKIDQVRTIVAENTVKGAIEAGGLDPEIMALIDARIDYKLFIASDNIYTREELYDHFPFHEFNVQPEAIFVQQEIGIFPPRKHALKEELEYVARDVGDESVDFVMIEDLVGQATRANYKMRRAPLRIVKTKIYVGKERWEDFSLLQRFFRGAVRVAAAQIAYSGGEGGGVSPLLAMLTGARAAPVPMIADPATVEAERKAREEEAARREEELRRREEELRRREEEARRAAEETQKKLDADLRRIEEMLAAVAGLAKGRTRPRNDAEPPAPGPAPTEQPAAAPAATAEQRPAGGEGGDEDDSVPL